MTPESLLGPLEDLDEAPALGRRQRPGLHQRDTVADTGRLVLVVRLDLRGGPNDLAVQRMTLTRLQLDHDGLLHLVRDDIADRGLATVTRHLGAGRVLRALRGICHYESSPPGPAARPNSRSRNTV